MNRNRILIENKLGYSIQGEVNPKNNRVGSFTVTPDHINITYPIVTHAQRRVKQLWDEKEKQRKDEEAAFLRKVRANNERANAIKL